MTAVRLRPRAEADLVERTRSYRRTAGDDVAGRFFDAAMSTLRLVADMPGSGSPRAADLSGVPGLPMARIRGFPCAWFYLERADHVDVVRLLADRQDLPPLFVDA